MLGEGIPRCLRSRYSGIGEATSKMLKLSVLHTDSPPPGWVPGFLAFVKIPCPAKAGLQGASISAMR